MEKLTLQKAQKEVENIRTTSNDMPEVIKRLVLMWRRQGVEVTFNHYPNVFKLNVSNSHSSPKGYKQNFSRRPYLPTYYPGWEGIWEGVVKTRGTIKQKIIPFSDLIGGAPSFGLPKIHWIKTGTGSANQQFNVSGELFLYDFENIYKNKQLTHIDLIRLRSDYVETFCTYRRYYRLALDDYLKKNSTLNAAKDLQDYTQKYMQKYTFKADSMTNSIEHDVIDKFNATYNTPMPMPSGILNEKAQKEVKKSIQGQVAYGYKPVAYTDAIVERLNKLTMELIKYKEDFPEAFI